jgi:tRNA U55 pseudouridine synthase TruB
VQVGCFDEADALTLETTAEQARERLLPIGQAVSELPRVVLAKEPATRLLHGQRIRHPVTAASEVAVFNEGGRLLAIAAASSDELHVLKGLARPSFV